MNFLLLALGSAGDVHPFVGIGRRLRERGHGVALATNPYFQSLVERSGLGFIPISSLEEYRSALENPDLWHPTRAFPLIVRELILPLLRPLYELSLERWRADRAVVVAPSTALGARVAQEKHGVPLVTVHLQPAMFRSEFASPVLGPLALGPGVPRWFKRLQFWIADKVLIDRSLEPVNDFLRELDLPRARSFFGRWYHSPQKVLGVFPDWFAPPQPDWPPNTVLTGFPLWDERGVTATPPELEAFLSVGSPPIVFTPGSAMLHGHEFFNAAVSACQKLGRRGLLLTRHPEQLPRELPASVMHCDFAPLSSVLPSSAALVHHGGVGTAAQGLAAGVPHLVMPMSHDQPDNAARLARLGVGSWLTPKQFQGPNVAAALAKLLDSPTVAASCRQTAARLADIDGLTWACEEIETLDAVAGEKVVIARS